jgi:hypothetical protein
VKPFLRELGLVAAIAGGAGLLLGLILGLLTGDGVLTWLAYGLDIAGAVMIGLGFLAGPESPRKRYVREKILKEEAPPKGESRLLPFVLVGVALVGAGTLFELAI